MLKAANLLKNCYFDQNQIPARLLHINIFFKDNEYFDEHHGDKEVSVAVTPNGFADSPVGDRKIFHQLDFSSDFLSVEYL